MREAQQRLVELGYDPGVPDGLMGPNTARAIAAFQADAGQPQTGRVTNALLARLRSAGSGSNGGGSATGAQEMVRPSFDCARAGTATEHAICGSSDLARLDRQLAETYALALSRASSPGQLRVEQRAWLEARNRCAGNAACLRASMAGRLAALGGGEGTRQAEGTPGITSSEGAGALPRFARDVYLIRLAEPRQGSSMAVFFSTRNFGQADPNALSDAIADAIAARPLVRGLPAEPVDLVMGAMSTEGYALVAGDWVNRTTHAIETSFPNQDFKVIQIAQGAGAGSTGDRTGATPAPFPAADFEADDRPILRAWLPHFLDRTTDAEQIELIEKYIGRLQANRDHSANLLFGEGEIEDRQAGFLARDVHDRWRQALAAQILEPPLEMHVRGEVRNLDYDHDTGELALFADHETPGTYFQSISHTILQTDIIESGGLSRSEENLGVRPPSHPLIGLDRELPTRFPMPAGRVERMIGDRDIVIYDVALRVTNVDEREDKRGSL
ncbi:MAG: peptidoglycan-binding protein [Paracoccaceae bacterium]